MITRRDFGDDSRGNATELITLVNKKGTEVSVSTFGGVVVTFIFADISIEKTVDYLIERETKKILQVQFRGGH